MRVLINGLQAGNLSGTGRYTIELARRQPELCDDVDCVVLWPRHVTRPPLAASSEDAFLLVDVERAAKRMYVDQWGVRGHRRRVKADIVHYPASIGSLLPMRGMVLTVHDLSALRNPAWFGPGRAAYYRFAIGRSARLATRIIADSQATAADLQDLFKISVGRIDVIPLGVGDEFQPAPVETQSAARAWYKLPESFFLYVGTLEPRKNLVRLIEAFARIAGGCPHDLVIAGRDGWKTKPIRAAAAHSPYAKRIHFPGFIAHEDLPAVLSAAHVFVWPSLYEGFGLPPLEAMACGTPVVTSNKSSLPEVVGDAALTVDPISVDAIAAAMLQVAEHESVRQDLERRGADRAKVFTWDRTAQLTVQTYRAAWGER